jgi:Icc-related predicted phosphoesterase
MRWGLCSVALALLNEASQEAEPPLRTFSDAKARYQTECPVPFFTLEQPTTLTVLGHTFRVEGSRLAHQGGAWKGPLNLGILGAIKDATAETQGNVQQAVREFEKRSVHFIIANGDISEGEFDLEDAFNMLGRETRVPVLVHIGNSEGKGSFTRAYMKANATYPHLLNMNWMRHVDLDGIHLLALPGYYNPKFLHGAAGCRYHSSDVQALGRRADHLARTGPVILIAHGPPRSFGPQALDVTQDRENVGDPDMAGIIETSDIRFGIFGHILESGGRITGDLKLGKPIKLPMQGSVDRLYLNAGSVSATPWAMLDETQSYGMAAVFSLDKGRGRAEIIKLRKAK